MRANSKILLTALLGMVLMACGSSPPKLKTMSQVEVRQMQSRTYSGSTPVDAMRAIIAALQDEGFVISEVDKDLGLITSSKEVTEVDYGGKFWYGAAGTYQTAIRYVSSISVLAEPVGVKVRINVVAKAITNSGGLNWSQPVQEPLLYQTLFSKIDKSLFITKKGL